MVSADRIRVTLNGGAPWGFRLSGGGGLPLIINKIRKKSQAHVQGLKEGDAVISINSVHVHDKTQDEALELVEATGDSLTLEIFRGDIEELSRDKPRKTIQVPSHGSASGGTLRLVTTGDDGVSPGEVVLIPSGDRAALHSLGSPDGPKSTSNVPIRLVSVDSTSVRTVIAPVRHTIISAKTTVVDKSPAISVVTARHDLQSASSQPYVSAKPFFVAQASSPSPEPHHPHPTAHDPQPSGFSSKSHVISATHAHHTKLTPSSVPQPPRSPQPPPVSPKPSSFVAFHPSPLSPKPQSFVAFKPSPLSPKPQSFVGFQPSSLSPKPQSLVAYQPPPVNVKPPGVTSTVTSSTFDDGQTHRQVTREQHTQRSDHGSRTTVVQRETTTTTTGRPSFVKNQASGFNTIQPRPSTDIASRPNQTTSVSVKSSSNIIHQKGPTPFVSPSSSNVLQPHLQAPIVAASHITDSQFLSSEAPLFKPTRFVPGSGNLDTQSLYSPTSPQVDLNHHVGFKDGKENVSPQPMFQVKSIVADRTKGSGAEMWRPNMWLPGQQPSQAEQEADATAHRDDSAFPASMSTPGYSIVEEQKRKLMALQSPRIEYGDVYNQENFDDQDHQKHSDRLHVFAPPVEIHAGQGPIIPPFGSPYAMDEYEECLSSPDSYGTRKKNLYNDSAFYDTPGKSYPTITEQMKLCKTIAQSLTSAANRRARGAKMFMKRKRKSTKWIHEGHSELSSSAGDVANLHELDSELNHFEGGNKPLLYFKIPSLKNRVGDESKQTKMALTQEQFEKLRLSSKKCDHTALPPDPCFDIVADLKAHKGKGGRMFERRKQRSDKFVIDETTAKFPHPRANIGNNSQQIGGQHLNPREVAMKHGWKGDGTSSLPHEAPLQPLVRSSLKSDDSPCLLKGANFNRTAKGWSGGGEYPVADRLQHISPTRDLGPHQSTQFMSQEEEQNYNKVQAWQASSEPSSLSNSFYGWPQEHQEPGTQNYGQHRAQDDARRKGWAQADHQGSRPKSWHPESYVPEYGAGPGVYPAVAYKQPIIPGTDL